MKEAEFPQSFEEARDHIRQIRSDKGLGEGPHQFGNNAADLEAALRILSNDLYQTSTHFLLELIQNADDNHYDNPSPALSITYDNGWVRVDCNERGFSRRHVEAICRICYSTKSGKSKSAGFVGEKGIGFKAVFKVASSVWISSGNYTFRFDRDAHLGMIAPIWDSHPRLNRSAGSSILLKLDSECDEDRVIEELRSYDERSLLFLRRLRRLDISVVPRPESARGGFETQLCKEGEFSKQVSTMVLTRNGEEKHYFVWRHQAATPKDEPLRPGITSSEIVLAFPCSIKANGQIIPCLGPQHAYAFLPICDSGFNFLLQADFLLSADRGDIRLDLDWNQDLAHHAAIAFADAARYMASMGNNLRYDWIAYIPANSAPRGFFQDLREKIISNLTDCDVLENWSGKRTKPRKLTHVPADYRDHEGTPFVLSESTRHQFLNKGYPETEVWRLNDTKMKTMGAEQFRNELANIPPEKKERFLAGRSSEWHVSFAQALLSPRFKTTVKLLPLIPLRGGKWVSWDNKIYFPRGPWSPVVPEGIDINVVDDEAAEDPDRRALYAQLGVQDLAPPFIREAIMKTHGSQEFDPKGLSTEVLVSHAEVFWRADDPSRGYTPKGLWVVSETGTRQWSDTMYLPSDVPGAASKLLRQSASDGDKFVHPAYTAPKKLAEREDWPGYLVTGLSVSIYPRLFDRRYMSLDSPRPFATHDDFTAVMEQPGNAWLTLLRDGWGFYKRWLVDVTEINLDHQASLQRYLKEHKVYVRGSSEPVALESTYVPLRPMSEYGHLVPLLDIPSPNDPRWEPVLTTLGVGSKMGVAFHLACLKGAKKSEKIPFEEIRQIMHRLETELDGGDGEKLRGARDIVLEYELIHIPARGGSRGTWVAPSDCFWRGAPWLTQSACLERHYPDLEVLFRRHLLIPNASVSHYMSEARALPRLDRPVLAHVKKLLAALAVQHSAGYVDEEKKEEIRQLEIFPVAPAGGGHWCLMTAADENPWLIADRENLRTQFQDLLPLLAFDGAFVQKIRELLRAVGLQSRFLSESATSETKTVGEAIFNDALTQRYRDRSKYFFRLTPEGTSDRHHIFTKFSSINVFSAPRIIQHWHAPLGLQRIESAPADGAAFLESDAAGNLRIYVRDGEVGYPHELVEHLRAFFGITAEHRELIGAAMTSEDDVVEALFEARGVAPLLEEGVGGGSEEEEGEDWDAEYTPVQFLPEASKASRPRVGGDSRFSRLLGSTRFAPAFFKNGGPSGSLPSYDTALDRSAQNAMGRPAEPRATSNAVTLTALRGQLSKMEFVKKEDAEGLVVGRPVAPPSFFDKFKSKIQRDSGAAEAMVSDILGTVLGPQYDKTAMWNTKRGRKDHQAAFRFADTQGRFGAFLMRLEGLPGNSQGYTRLIYHLDVKVSDGGSFELSQSELDRARRYSVHSQPNPEEDAPTKDVSVLVTISDLRAEPQIRFLADPWDLYQDGQLLLKSRTTYTASFNPRVEKRADHGGGTGFDAIQIRERTDGEEEEPPGYEKGKAGRKRILGKGK